MMGQSRKKKPGGGNSCAPSDKPFKIIEHRRERHAVAAKIRKGDEPPDSREFGSSWASPKDGKQYWVDHDEKWMRK